MGDPRDVATRWAKAYDSHDEHQLASVLAERAVLVSPEGVFEGRAAIVGYMMAWARAFGGGYTIERISTVARAIARASSGHACSSAQPKAPHTAPPWR